MEFQTVERRKWTLGHDGVEEQLHDQLLQWMKMRRDFQQVGSDKPEAGALGLVYKTAWSRGHILPLHTVLRMDAHTALTMVSRSNIQTFEGQRLTYSPHKARQHTSTENTHILKPSMNAFLRLYLQKAMQNPY